MTDVYRRNFDAGSQHINRVSLPMPPSGMAAALNAVLDVPVAPAKPVSQLRYSQAANTAIHSNNTAKAIVMAKRRAQILAMCASKSMLCADIGRALGCSGETARVIANDLTREGLMTVATRRVKHPTGSTNSNVYRTKAVKRHASAPDAVSAIRGGQDARGPLAGLVGGVA